MFKELKYFITRGKRGFSERDLWSAHDYLCDIIPQMVRSYKNGYGCPQEFYDKKNVNKECQKWNDTLEEIAQGFEAAKEITDCHFYFDWKNNKKIGYIHDYNPKKNKELTKKYERGQELFKKHFFSLWD